MDASHQAQRTVMIFIRDKERDIGTGFKTRVTLVDGELDYDAWQNGEYACDCVRGHILYVGGRFACGTSRFVVEQVVDYESGEAWPVNAAGEGARRVPAAPHAPRYRALSGFGAAHRTLRAAEMRSAFSRPPVCR